MTCGPQRRQSPRERFARLDLLEVAASLAATRVRWEVRGPDMVLCGDLPHGQVELIPRGHGRCELRLLGQDPRELPALMAALDAARAGSPRPEPASGLLVGL